MRVLRGLAVVAAVGTVLAALPSVASAAPPEPSAATASSSTVAQGSTVTVAVELYNPEDFAVTFGNASLRIADSDIVGVFDLVSCDVTCSPYFTSFRGAVGEMAPGEERTVEFTLRAKDDAVPGAYTFEHQFVGENYAFAAGPGPAITVTGQPRTADLAVALDASPRGILTSRITYTVAVRNDGPAAATNVTIRGGYALGLSWSGGTGCSRVGNTRTVDCTFTAIPAGGTAHASFSVNAGLLTLGSFPAVATRLASTPTDPNSGNDSASRSCAALTGLLVRC